MKWMRMTVAFAALATGALGGPSGELNASGPQQCYRKWTEPLDACSMCMGTCMGDGCLCCTILPG
ncbi:MAG TPA: hypothetical protein VJT67_09790 [Longimicrobiaceae bacterium]|nr:hypothetical protein [Longimicrobiaceae bacterium]